MTDLDTEVGQASPATLLRRSLVSRIRLGHVVMVLAAIVALLLNLAVLRSDDATIDIAVASAEVRAGTTLELSHIDEVAIPADTALTARLLPATEIEHAVGRLIVRPIQAGHPILLSDLLAVDAGDGLRAMSVPIDQSRAVSGQLTRGDTVDIVLVADGVATYVAAGIEVLDVPSAETNALGARSGYAPTVAVDSSQALRIAAALDSGEVHIIRSTGAQHPELMQLRAIDESGEEPSE